MTSFFKEKQKKYACQFTNVIVPELVKCCQITSLVCRHVLDKTMTSSWQVIKTCHRFVTNVLFLDPVLSLGCHRLVIDLSKTCSGQRLTKLKPCSWQVCCHNTCHVTSLSMSKISFWQLFSCQYDKFKLVFFRPVRTSVYLSCWQVWVYSVQSLLG